MGKSRYPHKVIHHPAWGKFDSTLELNRYIYLLSLEKKGVITNLKRQVAHQFVPPLYETRIKKMKRVPDKVYKVQVEDSLEYWADFEYDKGDVHVVEDTKSEATRKDPVYRVKRQLMRGLEGIFIKEVLRATEPV